MDGAVRSFFRAVREVVLRRPSAAMVVAMIAVLIALGAPSYAAQGIQVLFAKQAGNANKVDGIKASRKPHANQLLALDSHGRFPASVGAIGPRGPEGAAGTPGQAGQAGPQGDRGSNGAPGSAVAYSMIHYGLNDAGTQTEWRIEDSLSKRLDNDVNFTKPDGTQGVFCLHDLSFTVANLVATPGPLGPDGTPKPFGVEVDMARPGHALDGVNGCPANTDAIIYTTGTAGALQDPDQSESIFFELN